MSTEGWRRNVSDYIETEDMPLEPEAIGRRGARPAEDFIRVEDLLEPRGFEAIDLCRDPNRHNGVFAVALVRWSSGQRRRACCIETSYPMGALSSIEGLDGNHRITGPIISPHGPNDKDAVMAHIKYPLWDGIHPLGDDIFIIRKGYDGRCGIYDFRLNPFGNADREDDAVREEAFSHAQERDAIGQRLHVELRKVDFLESDLRSSRREIETSQQETERLGKELRELEARGGVKDQRQFDLLILGLSGVGFDGLSVVDQKELLSALERELYRVVHPDRFISPDRNTNALQTAATRIIQQKIAAIDRLKKPMALSKA